MEFKKIASAIFEAAPEFKDSYYNELDEDAPYLFLSGFGIFVRDSIVNKKPYAFSSISSSIHL
jgi:hypothetical protein